MNSFTPQSVEARVVQPWAGRSRIYGAALAECLIGGFGFALLGRIFTACVAFILRVSLVSTVVLAALFAFDDSMGDPCRPQTSDHFFERLARCKRNARYTYYGSLIALGVVPFGSAAWIVWRGDETI